MAENDKKQQPIFKDEGETTLRIRVPGGLRKVLELIADLGFHENVTELVRDAIREKIESTISDITTNLGNMFGSNILAAKEMVAAIDTKKLELLKEIIVMGKDLPDSRKRSK